MKLANGTLFAFPSFAPNIDPFSNKTIDLNAEFDAARHASLCILTVRAVSCEEVDECAKMQVKHTNKLPEVRERETRISIE